MTKKIVISVATACICATGLVAEDIEEFGANVGKLSQKELSSTQAVEIYSRKDIENSKAKDIYEFLGSNTSVITAPYFGNKFAQSLDIRGFGGQNGYEDVVVVIDGKRVNSIDQTSQLLSAISIDSIKKIEILKGSGGVEYGDGANSVISITTMDYDGFTIGGSYGTYNTKKEWATYGYKGKNFNISASGDFSSDDGARKFDSSGNDANSFARNGSISVKYLPTDALLLSLSKNYSHIDTRYSGSLTEAQFDNNPSMSGNGPSRQVYDIDSINGGVSYDFGHGITMDLNIFDDKKTSNNVTYSWKSYYDYKSFNGSIAKKTSLFEVLVGIDGFDGKRESVTNDTSKSNLAVFAKSIVKLGNSTLELGARDEKVTYKYIPNSAAGLDNSMYLQAYSLGYNYKIDKSRGLFANYSKSYVAPDIDCFFATDTNTFATIFNGFIKPQKVDNYNLGYSLIGKSDKLKLSLFYAKLQDEIFYNPLLGAWGTNTNLDSTHKTGFELSEKHRFDDIYAAFVNYSYVEAKIDTYAGDSTYSGKYIPGVSKHNLVFGVDMTPTKAIKLSASEKLRSSAYNYDDFENTGNNKVPVYRSTDLSASYSFKNYEVYTKATNIFGAKNAIVTSSVGYYPTDFEATYTIGFKAKF